MDSQRVEDFYNYDPQNALCFLSIGLEVSSAMRETNVMIAENNIEKVLVCRCANADFLSDADRQRVEDALEGRGIAVAIVDDLCERASAGDPSLAAFADKGGLTVLACHPRAVRWLMSWAHSVPEGKSLDVVNLRDGIPDGFVGSLPGAENASDNSVVSLSCESPGKGVSWFPVLDYDRCVNCKQCISFCPFGVYALDGGGIVRVVHPENCKDQCPACARMCPSVAIIFPKVKDNPINGDIVTEEEVERRKAEALQARLKDGDIHSILAKRKLRAKQRKLGNS